MVQPWKCVSGSQSWKSDGNKKYSLLYSRFRKISEKNKQKMQKGAWLVSNRPPP
jgi:hypothetical protein